MRERTKVPREIVAFGVALWLVFDWLVGSRFVPAESGASRLERIEGLIAWPIAIFAACVARLVVDLAAGFATGHRLQSLTLYPFVWLPGKFRVDLRSRASWSWRMIPRRPESRYLMRRRIYLAGIPLVMSLLALAASAPAIVSALHPDAKIAPFEVLVSLRSSAVLLVAVALAVIPNRAQTVSHGVMLWDALRRNERFERMRTIQLLDDQIHAKIAMDRTLLAKARMPDDQTSLCFYANLLTIQAYLGTDRAVCLEALEAALRCWGNISERHRRAIVSYALFFTQEGDPDPVRYDKWVLLLPNPSPAEALQIEIGRRWSRRGDPHVTIAEIETWLDDRAHGQPPMEAGLIARARAWCAAQRKAASSAP